MFSISIFISGDSASYFLGMIMLILDCKVPWLKPEWEYAGNTP